jgi:hypothetical protein
MLIYKPKAQCNISTATFLMAGISALCSSVLARVARWHSFKPKVPIWVNFGGPYNGRCWHIFWQFGLLYLHPFGVFYVHLVHLFPFWYVACRKIWQPWTSGYFWWVPRLGLWRFKTIEIWNGAEKPDSSLFMGLSKNRGWNRNETIP